MNFIQRLAFYLGGAAIGCVIVYFIWQKKNTEICYFPNCRVLKDLRVKKRAFAPEVQQLVNDKSLDTAAITYTYYNGDVDFERSNTKLKSCKTYYISSSYENKQYEFFVENCDSTATIKQVSIK